MWAKLVGTFKRRLKPGKCCEETGWVGTGRCGVRQREADKGGGSKQPC